MTRVSTIRVLVLSVVLAFCAPALAQKKISKSHLAAAKELVYQTQMAKSFDVFVPQLGLRLLQNITRTRPELKKDLDTVLDKVVPEMEKEKFTLINRTARFFAEAMTEDEIKKVIAFHKTPAGKKYLDQQPKVLDRMVLVMDGWNRDLSERMLTRVREEMKKKGHDI